MTVMVIQRISIRNFGGIFSYDASFVPSLNIVRTREIPTLLAAIQVLVCSKAVSQAPPEWVRNDTRLTARVLLENAVYSVSATVCDGQLTLTVTDAAGADATELYRDTLNHCAEQDATDCFDGLDQTAATRLFRYRNVKEIPENLSERTDRLADTRIFRAHLIRYIKAFQPEPIHSQKSYLAAITPQGKFEVIHPDIPGRVFLSETEKILFHYICFLNAAEFWDAIEKSRDLHYEKKPLLVRNFLEYLDESTKTDRLMARTVNLQRQVLIVTPAGQSSPLL